MMKGADCLGVCLAWTRTRGSSMVLQIIFGMTATSVSLYLRFGRRILVEVLKSEPLAAIRVPNIDNINTYQAAIRKKHPALEGVWCYINGLKLCFQQAGGDVTTQNNFYNGWTHDHYVTSIFVFCPEGTIPICCFNVPVQLMIAKLQNGETCSPNCLESSILLAESVLLIPPFLSRNFPFLSSEVNRILLLIMSQISQEG